MFFKIDVKKLRKFHRKTPLLESLFNKVAGLEACYFIKKRLQRRYFSVVFVKFLITPFSTEHLWWLLLKKSKPTIIHSKKPAISASSELIINKGQKLKHANSNSMGISLLVLFNVINKVSDMSTIRIK